MGPAAALGGEETRAVWMVRLAVMRIKMRIQIRTILRESVFILLTSIVLSAILMFR